MAPSDLDRQTAASGADWSTASVIAVVVAAMAILLIGSVLHLALREVPLEQLSDAQRLALVHDKLGDGWSCEAALPEITRAGVWWYSCSTRNPDEVRKRGVVVPEYYDEVVVCDVTLSRNGDVAKRSCTIPVPYMGG